MKIISDEVLIRRTKAGEIFYYNDYVFDMNNTATPYYQLVFYKIGTVTLTNGDVMWVYIGDGGKWQKHLVVTLGNIPRQLFVPLLPDAPDLPPKS